MNVRVIAIGEVKKVELQRHPVSPGTSQSAQTGKRKMFYRGKSLAATVYERSRLKSGHRIPGPAVITQSDSTTVILPGHSGEVDPYLNILIWPNGRSRANAAKVSAREARAGRGEGVRRKR